MFAIDPIVLREWLFVLSSFIDSVALFKTVLCVSPLATGLIVAFKAAGGKKAGVGFLLPVSYLLLSLLFFITAAGDVFGEGRYFISTGAAAITGAALFCVQIAALVFFVFSIDEKKPKKKKYAAYVEETPVFFDDELTKKAYPLKALATGGEKSAEPDFDGFLKFLQKIDDERLSFFDQEEYNSIVKKAKFLSGVEINDSTAPEFCSLFMRSIKLAARNAAD